MAQIARRRYQQAQAIEIGNLDEELPHTTQQHTEREREYRWLDAAGERYEIRLTSPQGEPLVGSARQVNAPRNPPFTRLLVLPILPLLLGAVVLNRRQSRVKMPRGFTG